MWEIFLIAGGICQHGKASIWLGEAAENMRPVVGGVVASAHWASCIPSLWLVHYSVKRMKGSK